MQASLLIGNDINSLSPGYDWEKLLEDLVGYVGAENSISSLSVQFPLFYEEIHTFANTNKTKNETEIKEYISEKVQELEPNDIHKELISLDVEDILTTNYEFTLEKSCDANISNFINEGKVSERKYSIFRHCYLNKKRFWHMHGDAHNPNSIALGYEHYSGYLQNMRNYVVTGVGNSYKNFKKEPLARRIKSSLLTKPDSWLDIFLAKDIHIVGLGLDFVEIHLWWLITYRARMHSSSNITKHNKITYYCPKQREDLDHIKLRFLESNKIDIVYCDRPRGNKIKYYDEVIKEIRKRIK